MNPRRVAMMLAVLSLCAVALTGCVKRNMHIVSDPPGALVYMNDDKIGETPLDYDFLDYAVHKFELKKEGYKSVSELVNIKPPFFSWLGIDLIFELIPYAFWDRKEMSYKLEPAPSPEEAEAE